MSCQEPFIEADRIKKYFYDFTLHPVRNDCCWHYIGYSRIHFIYDRNVLNAAIQISFTEFLGQQNINRLKLRQTSHLGITIEGQQTTHRSRSGKQSSIASFVKGCQTSARIIMLCQIFTQIRVQMLDKPRGRKPRGVAGLFEGLRCLWGF